MRRSFALVVPVLVALVACAAPPAEDAPAEGSDALVGWECTLARPTCDPGRICTFELDARVGQCVPAGALGGPCGGTVWQFAGAECQSGLVCELGKMAYPMDGHLTTREQANPSSGICRRPPGTAGACTSDRACGFGETCRRAAGSRSGTCLPADVPPADAGAAPPCAAMTDCAAPRVCTFAPGAYAGACMLPGKEGGLCGSTYSSFSGGSCDPGLRCVVGAAAFPTDGLPATDRGWNVGVCSR